MLGAPLELLQLHACGPMGSESLHDQRGDTQPEHGEDGAGYGPHLELRFGYECEEIRCPSDTEAARHSGDEEHREEHAEGMPSPQDRRRDPQHESGRECTDDRGE